MTDFSSLLSLLSLTGLSNSEAAEYLDVNITTIGRWKSGKAPVPQGVIDDLNTLMESIKLVAEGHDIELPYKSSYKMAAVRKLLLTDRKNFVTT